MRSKTECFHRIFRERKNLILTCRLPFVKLRECPEENMTSRRCMNKKTKTKQKHIFRLLTCCDRPWSALMSMKKIWSSRQQTLTLEILWFSQGENVFAEAIIQLILCVSISRFHLLTYSRSMPREEIMHRLLNSHDEPREEEAEGRRANNSALNQNFAAIFFLFAYSLLLAHTYFPWRTEK